MIFDHKKADVFVPDESASSDALRRTTHLGIMAHQDDLEISSFHGIAACFQNPDHWFGGVVITDGAGSPRSGPYANFTDDRMQEVRRQEQRKAAVIGEYGVQIQLGYASAEVKDPANNAVIDDLSTILEISLPDVVYLHNPADRHETHVACCLRALAALRRMPAEQRPKKVYGCEAWRNLDWMLNDDKELLEVDAFPNLAAALIGVFDSQISGGKRYDLAAEGHQRANATLFDSHSTDTAEKLTFAMDLTPLIADDTLDIQEYTLAYIDRLRNDIVERLKRLSPE